MLKEVVVADLEAPSQESHEKLLRGAAVLQTENQISEGSSIKRKCNSRMATCTKKVSFPLLVCRYHEPRL